jgi:hypothetical protein
MQWFAVISKLILDNQPIEQVSKFNYLGCQLSYQGEVDVNHKLEKFNYRCGNIKRNLKNKTRTEIQIKFYKVKAIPAGLYGSENWVLAEKDKNRLQAAEMRFLRSTMGVTREDRLTNEAIRKKTLNMNSLNGTISKYIDSWFNHIRRMDHSRFPRHMLSYKPTGKRSLCRPRKRWISQIRGAATGKVQCMK